MRLEGLGQIKIQRPSSGIEPAAFRLVVQSLNQIRYRVPQKVKVKVMLRPTVQSASPSWYKAPIWGLRPDLYYCRRVCRLVDVGRSL
jgi:hypothetical protein